MLSRHGDVTTEGSWALRARENVWLYAPFSTANGTIKLNNLFHRIFFINFFTFSNKLPLFFFLSLFRYVINSCFFSFLFKYCLRLRKNWSPHTWKKIQKMCMQSIYENIWFLTRIFSKKNILLSNLFEREKYNE